MKLSELIAKYGDEIVQFQNLDHCVDDFQMTKKGTKARFGTEQQFDLNGFKKIGFIVWMDRERVAEIIAADKAKSPPAISD